MDNTFSDLALTSVLAWTAQLPNSGGVRQEVDAQQHHNSGGNKSSSEESGQERNFGLHTCSTVVNQNQQRRTPGHANSVQTGNCLRKTSLRPTTKCSDYCKQSRQDQLKAPRLPLLQNRQAIERENHLKLVAASKKCLEIFTHANRPVTNGYTLEIIQAALKHACKESSELLDTLNSVNDVTKLSEEQDQASKQVITHRIILKRTHQRDKAVDRTARKCVNAVEPGKAASNHPPAASQKTRIQEPVIKKSVSPHFPTAYRLTYGVKTKMPGTKTTQFTQPVYPRHNPALAAASKSDRIGSPSPSASSSGSAGYIPKNLSIQASGSISSQQELRLMLSHLGIGPDKIEQIIAIKPHLMQASQLDHTLKYEIGLNDQNARLILEYLKPSDEVDALMYERRQVENNDKIRAQVQKIKKIEREAKAAFDYANNLPLAIKFSLRDMRDSRFTILAIGSQIDDKTGLNFDENKTVFADMNHSDLNGDIHKTIDDIPSGKKFREIHLTGLPGYIFGDAEANRRLFKKLNSLLEDGGSIFVKFGLNSSGYNNTLFINNVLRPSGFDHFIIPQQNIPACGVLLSARKVQARGASYQKDTGTTTVITPPKKSVPYSRFQSSSPQSPAGETAQSPAFAKGDKDINPSGNPEEMTDGVLHTPVYSNPPMRSPSIFPQLFDVIRTPNEVYIHKASTPAFNRVLHRPAVNSEKFQLIKQHSGRQLEDEEIIEALRLGMEPSDESLQFLSDVQIAQQIREFIGNQKQEAANELSMGSLQPNIRNGHQHNYVPAQLHDAQQSLASLDEFSSLPPITRAQEQAFSALQRFYKALKIDDLPDLIRHSFLNPVAVEILRDSDDYRHRYKAQEIYSNFIQFKRRKELEQTLTHRESLIQAGTAIPAPAHGLSPDVLRIKQSILTSGETGLNKREIDHYCDGVEPKIIEKLGEQNFKMLLMGFLEMKRLMALGTVYDDSIEPELAAALKAGPDHMNPVELLPQDFHVLINNNLIKMEDLQKIATNGFVAVKGLYELLMQQFPITGMKGAGLTNWGNTCWLNTGIQTLFRMISPDQVQQLRPQLDQDLEQLRLSFQRLMMTGQSIIHGEQASSVITRNQIDFMEALLTCGRAGKLGAMNTWFNCTRIQDIAQQDTADFVSLICLLLGVYADGSQSMETVNYFETTIGKQRYYKKKEGDVNQITHTLTCFRPVSHNSQTIRMIDWFHSITQMEAENRMVPWTPADLRLSGKSGLARELPTREKCMLKVDPAHFKKTIIALGVQGHRELARSAFLNSSRLDNNELKIPVIDARDNKQKTMVMRLCGAGLHRGAQHNGHYIHMNIGPQGDCEIQDDRLALPFQLYRQYLAEGNQIRTWQEMVEKMELVPAYCEYEFVRLED